MRCEQGALAEVAALVPQSAFLFDDTVRDNVTLGADLSDEQVWEALRTAQADGFVAALPARARQPHRASAGPPCPEVSGSGCRWPVPWCAAPACW